MSHYFFFACIFLLMHFFSMGQEWDIVLDPIEQTPELPSSRSLAAGNWGYEALKIPALHKQIYDRTERAVVVYIFDTGGKYDHPGLQRAAWNEKGRVFTGENAPSDGNGHSSHVASSYAGDGFSDEPVGICDPLLDKGMIHLIPIKVLTNAGSGSFSWLATALRDVNKEAQQFLDDGIFVIYNFSLGGGTSVIDYVEKEMQAAKDMGVFISAAAGNTGREGVGYPAIGPASHAVAAVDRNLNRASFSTTGDKVEFSAPGVAIYGCYRSSTYAELSGTSMATPHLGAVAAIVAAVWPKATAGEVAAHIAKYSKDLGDAGRDKLYGYGFPEMEKLITVAPGDGQQPPPPPPPPAPEPEPEPRPERMATISVAEKITVPYRTYTKTGYVDDRVTFDIEVDYTSTLPAEDAISSLGNIVRQHFARRGYAFGHTMQVDDAEAAVWCAFFFELIETKKGHQVDVKLMNVYSGSDAMQVKDFLRKKKIVQKTATIQGANTYEY